MVEVTIEEQRQVITGSLIPHVVGYNVTVAQIAGGSSSQQKLSADAAYSIAAQEPRCASDIQLLQCRYGFAQPQGGKNDTKSSEVLPY